MSRLSASGTASPAVGRRFPREIPGLGGVELRELQSLSAETDSRLRGEELLAFGTRLEVAGKPLAAAEVYRFLQESAEFDASTRERAEGSLGALQGRGAFGPRAEFLLRHFTHQATDYRMIVPMMLGSVAFGIGKNWALGRLLGTSEASLWTRSWGARCSASALGFGVELPTFVFSARLLSEESGPIEKDLLRASLSLGALKLFGRMGGEGAKIASGVPGLRRTASLLPETAAFGGLLVSHRLEAHFGWRPQVDDATWFVDALAATFSLGVGGRLGQRLLGAKMASFQAELNFRSELGTPMPSLSRERAVISAKPPGASPGSGAILMTSTPFERLIRWMEDRFYTSEVPPSIGMKDAMKVLLRRFPHLKRVLSRSPWTLEQKWEILKASTPISHRQPWEIFRFLPDALLAMERVEWSYEQQLRFLSVLGSLGEFPIPIHKYLGGAIAALRENPWSSQEKYDLLVSLAEQGGPHADRIYANLPAALQALREVKWSYREQSDLLHLLHRYGGAKIGTVLAHIPAALHYLKENEWPYGEQSKLLVLIAEYAPNDAAAAEMLEESLPACLGMMGEFHWSADRQARVLTRMMERAQEQASGAMEYLPGLLLAMLKLEWHQAYTQDTLESLFEIARGESGKFVEMLPSLLQTMSFRGLAIPTQREILEALAARAGEISKLSFLQFALALVRKPLHWKPS